MKKTLLGLFALITITLPCFADLPYQSHQTVNPYGGNTPKLHGSVFVVPVGTLIPVSTTYEIAAHSVFLGQSVSFMISQDYYYEDKLVAPAGSVVNGSIIQLKKAGLAGTNGEIQIRFTSIVTPFGQMIPISGKIRTEDGTGIIRGGTKADTAKEYAKDVSIGAAGGAVSGLIFSAISGGNVGKGAAIGTAIGGGAGLTKSILNKGGDVVIPANTNLSIILDQPITLNSSSTYMY